MLIKETMKKGAKEQKRHNYDYWNNDDNNDYVSYEAYDIHFFVEILKGLFPAFLEIYA